MITIQIANKEYEIPTEWNEVTLQQYKTLAHYTDRLDQARVLSILTGIEYKEICNLPCDEFQLKVIPEISFFNEPFDPLTQKRAKELHLDKYVITPILDPTKERFGQKLYMQQLVNSAIEQKTSHINLVAPVVACYYAPIIHPEKKWDEQHVKEVETLVLQMKVVEAYPEADFFLRGYIKYAPKKKTY